MDYDPMLGPMRGPLRGPVDYDPMLGSMRGPADYDPTRGPADYDPMLGPTRVAVVPRLQNGNQAVTPAAAARDDDYDPMLGPRPGGTHEGHSRAHSWSAPMEV